MEKEFVVVGLGEMLWDHIGEEYKLGGAPANFAYHAICLLYTSPSPRDRG